MVKVNRLANAARSILLPGLILAGIAACGPVPGGELAGEIAVVPSNWNEVLDEKAFCEIESREANPHSIQLECFLFDGELHVQSHRWVDASWWPMESWASIWQQEPNVVVRIGNDLFRLTAHVVTGTRHEILTARGYEPIPDGIVVFKFTEPET